MDFSAATDGDGLTRATPHKLWTTATGGVSPSTPRDLIVRGGSVGGLAPTAFPAGLRVYGGHALDAGWSRRLAYTTTRMSTATGATIDLAGSDALIDGITLSGQGTYTVSLGGSSAAVITRSILTGLSSAPVTVYCSGAPGAKLIGNRIENRPSAAAPVIVQMNACAAEFFFNDLSFLRAYTAVAVAFDAMGAANSTAKIAGNRIVAIPDTARATVAFRASAPGRFASAAFGANAIQGIGTTVDTYMIGATPSDLATLQSGVTSNGVANIENADCVENPFPPWRSTWAPRAACLAGAANSAGAAGLDLSLSADRDFEHRANPASIGADQAARPGPLGHWTFDDGAGSVAGDSAGSRDGSVLGAQWVTGSSCRKGGCLRFPGNGHVAVDATGLPVGAAPRTLALWVLSEKDLLSDREGGIAQYGSAVNGQMFGLITSANAPGRPYFYGHNADVAATTPLGQNAWHHVAATYDGNRLTLYVDGVAEGTRDGALNTTLSGDGFTIGLRPAGTYWTGLLDDVRIYDRALTANEVAALAR